MTWHFSFLSLHLYLLICRTSSDTLHMGRILSLFILRLSVYSTSHFSHISECIRSHILRKFFYIFIKYKNFIFYKGYLLPQKKWKLKVVQLCPTLCNPMKSPWNSLGQNTGVGSLFLLQGIFPTQGWNPGLPHCRWILYQLSHNGSQKRKSKKYLWAFHKSQK